MSRKTSSPFNEPEVQTIREWEGVIETISSKAAESKHKRLFIFYVRKSAGHGGVGHAWV